MSSANLSVSTRSVVVTENPFSVTGGKGGSDSRICCGSGGSSKLEDEKGEFMPPERRCW